MANGALVQGLKGSIAKPSAEPAGYIGKSLSDDGTHLVFGSTSKLENAATEGNLTIYERDLSAGTTQVVSTLPNGSTMTGTVAGLDVSSDGSRVLVGKAVSTDAKGNTYYDLYMHIGNSPNSVQVADTTNGVLFNGMTARREQGLLHDLRSAHRRHRHQRRPLPGRRRPPRRRPSPGSRPGPAAGNTDSCDPVPGKEGPDWNVLSGGPANCGVVALAGGAGVASGDGTVFFLSPEKLDGSGHAQRAEPVRRAARRARPSIVDDDRARPAKSSPTRSMTARSIATRTSRSAQNGDFAVLASTLPLTGFDTFDRSQVFRYDTDAGTLVCASCASTGRRADRRSEALIGPQPHQRRPRLLHLVEPLVLRDTNNRLDVYEWKERRASSWSRPGISNFDAGLLGVTSDGVNAFFFTRETLAPQDKNGETMKIYDAREGGGFLDIPPLPLCAAKDECHGPGTVSGAAAPDRHLQGRGRQRQASQVQEAEGEAQRQVRQEAKKKKKGKRSNG